MDEFIDRFYNGDYLINSKAESIQCSEEDTEKSLMLMLSESIAGYVTTKSNIERATENGSFNAAFIEHVKTTHRLLFWVTHARNTGIISESESMTSSLNKCEQENIQLKEQITSLRELNEKLARENSRLHKLFPDTKTETSEFGNVE